MLGPDSIEMLTSCPFLVSFTLLNSLSVIRIRYFMPASGTGSFAPRGMLAIWP